MKKILITGGAGFVGSHLVSSLAEKDYEIIIFDNLSVGTLDRIPQKENITFYKGDITDKNALLDAGKNVDVIVHLAAIVSVSVCENNPDLCSRNNIAGTQNIFEVAKELQIKKVIYASSAAVYGNLNSSSITETDEVHPISQYGISKLENEKTAEKYEDTISSIGLRFFNIYGPGLNMANAYPSVLIAFFQKIKQNEALTIFGDGKQTRDFIHVTDIAQAIIRSIEAETSGSHVYNVGTGTETSIIDLAEKIKSFIPETEISFQPKRDFDIEQSCADISKIKKELNFEPNKKIIDDLSELTEEYLK